MFSLAGNYADQIIGAQLRKQRTRLNISQKELGAVIGVSYQQIQKYESGKNKISAARLHRISIYMKVPMADFFTE